MLWYAKHGAFLIAVATIAIVVTAIGAVSEPFQEGGQASLSSSHSTNQRDPGVVRTTWTTQKGSGRTVTSGGCAHGAGNSSILAEANSTFLYPDLNVMYPLVFESPEVQSYIAKAYSFQDSNNVSRTSGASESILFLINVTASRVVDGNWTTGYNISYTGIRRLSTIVEFIVPCTYLMGPLDVVNYPDTHADLAYTASQQEMIRVALLASLFNQTVKDYLAPNGSGAYFVANVWHESQPVAFYADSGVQIDQVDGPRFVTIFIDSRRMSATFVAGGNYVSEGCGFNYCYTSPWNYTEQGST